MGRFGCLQAVKKEKAQTTSDSDENAADQNQFRRHEELLSQNFCLTGCIAVRLPGVCQAFNRATTIAYHKGR